MVMEQQNTQPENSRKNLRWPFRPDCWCSTVRRIWRKHLLLHDWLDNTARVWEHCLREGIWMAFWKALPGRSRVRTERCRQGPAANKKSSRPAFSREDSTKERKTEGYTEEAKGARQGPCVLLEFPNHLVKRATKSFHRNQSFFGLF